MRFELPKNYSTYIPAIDNDMSLHSWSRIQHEGYDMKWFTEKSFFQYPYALVSAYYNIDIKDYRLHHDYKGLLIADSGGFQLLTYAMKNKPVSFSPLQSLRWMEANADIGMNLDYPIWNNFEYSLTNSIENFKIFEQSRKNYDFLLYNVLHGRTLSELTTWYDLVKDFAFDGWAIGIRPSTNIYLQTMGYLTLHEKGASNLLDHCHFFGVSGQKNMICLALIARHFKTALTFDSSSYDIGHKIRGYYLPGNIRNVLHFGRDKTRLITKVPCHCPVCSHMTADMLYDNYPLTPSMLCLHNLYQTIEVNKLINTLADDPELLIVYAKSVGEENLATNMQAILNKYDSHGLDKTYESFSHLCKLPKQINTCETNLHSWM